VLVIRNGQNGLNGNTIMANWWAGFGKESMIAGMLLGLVVALIPILQRWWAAKKGHPSPERHGVLFALDVVHMGAFAA
jgi:Na+(H+)/acetate symporter ActP